MNPIAIFYHTLFTLGPDMDILPASLMIATEQMNELRDTGLLRTAREMICGINGGPESCLFANSVLPASAKKIYHGSSFRNECGTLRELEKWLPGHEDYYVLYFHTKGATHPVDNPLRMNWRNCMMKHLVSGWRKCVADLDSGYDSVGCHWYVPPLTPVGQSIWAGNFWWAKASFLKTLPSIMNRDRIKISGLDSMESRYEAEVWIGNGSRLPRVKDYHPGWRMHPNDH